MKKIEYLLFGGEPNHSGLYLNRVQALNDRGVEVTLVLKCMFSYRMILSYLFSQHDIVKVGPNTISQINKRVSGRIITIPYITGLPLIGKVVFAVTAMCVLLRKSRRCDQLVIHAMNSSEYILFIKKILHLKNIKVISEIEGDRPSEVEYIMQHSCTSHSSGEKQNVIDRAHRTQKWIIEASDVLLCPTENMQHLICDRSSISTLQKIYVFPFFASSLLFRYDENKREEMRMKLGLSSRFVVIYCGNLRDSWQMPSMLANVFKMINNLQDNAFFYILTPKSNEAFISPFLEGLPNSQYAFAEVEHSEIVDYLCAADCALLLREPHLMNKVVAPAKFAEYALTGLPIIMTNGIGYYPDIMKDNNNTLILDNLKDDDVIRTQITRFIIDQLPQLNRKAFAMWSSDRFSLELRILDLIKAYKYAAELQ